MEKELFVGSIPFLRSDSNKPPEQHPNSNSCQLSHTDMESSLGRGCWELEFRVSLWFLVGAGSSCSALKVGQRDLEEVLRTT
ncbi:hypothetical protein XELAEV_18043003mg [Xenopus laevis]|uniref:Uncharacterized protein n=1 Tax=Xenopus laevis TaxID=8355 RepID=A0A974H733_XENLA|nr:hypothetical protein XELAEV_18043003mg [Xenopus laevis]